MSSCTTGLFSPPPEEIRITLVGGLELVSTPNPVQIEATDFSAVQSIMAQLGPALAGLQPVLLLIDAVTALFEVMERAPEIPTDPAGFVQALNDAALKIAKLSSIVPQLSVPAMVLTTISACAKYLTAVIDQLTGIVAEGNLAQALMDQAVAAADTQLQTEAQCALDNVATLTAHASAAMGPIQGVMTTLTSLISFLPSPVDLPALPDTGGMAAQEMIDALQPVVDVLEALST